MKDFYKNTRECIDEYNEVMNVINTSAEETKDEQDEFLQHFCLHLAHALIKDVGFDITSREELCKTADIINDVLR